MINKLFFGLTKYRAIILLLLMICICFSSDAFAADPFSIGKVKGGTGIEPTFDEQLLNITEGIIYICYPIVIILTALSGALIAFGWDNTSKTMWTTIFGMCIALNIGYFIFEPGIFVNSIAPGGEATTNSGAVTDMATVIQLGDSSKADDNFLGRFMDRYQNLITYAAGIIIPYLDKLLLILLLIDTMVEASLNTNEGNKFRFLIDMCLKGGFFIFLIHHWLVAGDLGPSLMGALSHGFEKLGFIMGQGQFTTLQPDSIVTNAGKILTSLYEAMKDAFSLTSPNTWCLLIATPVIIFTLLMTSLEIFMVRIEFYTMALLTMPLLPFGVCKYTKFLSEKTFGVMFNIAIKCMAMAFIQSFSLPYIEALAKDFAGRTGDLNNILSLVMEFVLACLVIWYLTKNVKEIINTLLSGSPSLSGGGMTATAVNAGVMAGAAVGTVATAGGAAGGLSAISQSARAAGGNLSSFGGVAKGAAGGMVGAGNLVMSTLGNVAKAGMNKAIGDNPFSRGYRSAQASMRGSNGEGGLLRGPAGGEVTDRKKKYDENVKNKNGTKSEDNANKISGRAARVVGKASDGLRRVNNFVNNHPPEPQATTYQDDSSKKKKDDDDT